MLNSSLHLSPNFVFEVWYTVAAMFCSDKMWGQSPLCILMLRPKTWVTLFPRWIQRQYFCNLSRRPNFVSSTPSLIISPLQIKLDIKRQLKFSLQMGWFDILYHKRYGLPPNDVSGFVSNFKGTWILTWNKIRRPYLLLLGRAVIINC